MTVKVVKFKKFVGKTLQVKKTDEAVVKIMKMSKKFLKIEKRLKIQMKSAKYLKKPLNLIKMSEKQIKSRTCENCWKNIKNGKKKYLNLLFIDKIFKYFLFASTKFFSFKRYF